MDQYTRRLSLGVGIVAAGTAISLAMFFSVGGPFGTINDLGNAATGLLSGWLAWRLRGELLDRGGTVAVGLALIGAAITVVGSALVVSGATGFLFAGLVSSVGFAGIGTWLIVLNRSRDESSRWPQRLRLVGLVAGVLMALGIATAAGIPLGIDDMSTAPAWIWVGFIGWLGIYVVYPVWAIGTGLVEGRAVRPAIATSAVSKS